MDKIAHLRQIPLLTVMSGLGIDISQFKRRSNKAEHFGACVFHEAKTNRTSFSFHEDGRYFCFSCNEKGRGNVDFVKAYRHVGYQDAVAFLESIAGQAVQTPADTKKDAPRASYEASDGILRPFTGKYHLHQIELPWLEARCPDKAVRERYGIFAYYNPARKSRYQNKVFIPLKDVEGTLYGYLVRTPEPKEGENKYEFPAGFPKSQFLFGSDVLKAGTFGPVPLKRVWLVESPLCVLKFAMYGIPALAAYGWSVSDEQISLLRQLARGVVYIPDTNKYADSRPVVAEIAARLWVKAPPLPDGVTDPEHLTVQQIQSL